MSCCGQVELDDRRRAVVGDDALGDQLVREVAADADDQLREVADDGLDVSRRRRPQAAHRVRDGTPYQLSAVISPGRAAETSWAWAAPRPRIMPRRPVRAMPPVGDVAVVLELADQVGDVLGDAAVAAVPVPRVTVLPAAAAAVEMSVG
jgi:hypothetical protein